MALLKWARLPRLRSPMAGDLPDPFAGMAFGAESTGSAIGEADLEALLSGEDPDAGSQNGSGGAADSRRADGPGRRASQWRSILTRIRQPIGGRSVSLAQWRETTGRKAKGSRKAKRFESGCSRTRQRGGFEKLFHAVLQSLCPSHDDSGWRSTRRREQDCDGFFRQAARHSFRNHGHQRGRWSGQGELPENPTVEAQLGGGRPAKNPTGLPTASSCRISSDDRGVFRTSRLFGGIEEANLKMRTFLPMISMPKVVLSFFLLASPLGCLVVFGSRITTRYLHRTYAPRPSRHRPGSVLPGTRAKPGRQLGQRALLGGQLTALHHGLHGAGPCSRERQVWRDDGKRGWLSGRSSGQTHGRIYRRFIQRNFLPTRPRSHGSCRSLGAVQKSRCRACGSCRNSGYSQ